jgi:hypothetical protein
MKKSAIDNWRLNGMVRHGIWEDISRYFFFFLPYVTFVCSGCLAEPPNSQLEKRLDWVRITVSPSSPHKFFFFYFSRCPFVSSHSDSGGTWTKKKCLASRPGECSIVWGKRGIELSWSRWFDSFRSLPPPLCCPHDHRYLCCCLLVYCSWDCEKKSVS